MLVRMGRVGQEGLLIRLSTYLLVSLLLRMHMLLLLRSIRLLLRCLITVCGLRKLLGLLLVLLL